MKWFDKWFAKKCQQAWENARNGNEIEPEPNYIGKPARVTSRRASTGSDLHANGTTFTLYNASGGYVVELRNYDLKTDEYKNSLHVIPTGDELGKNLEHIITLEALKK
jgi:hypothetical protein